MTEQTSTWLELKNIEVWQNNHKLVEDLSMDLSMGEPTTILGPNGSGKSTLIKLIERRLHPVVKRGSQVRLFGQEIIHLQELRQRIGVLNSELDERIPATCSIREVILSGFFGSTRLGHGQRPTTQQCNQAATLLDRFELSELEMREFRQLSDGQKRRLLIARALIHQPEVLVLDEPARALDLRSCHQLLRVISSLCQDGVTVVQVTHRIETIVPEMKRIIFLQDGKVISQGSPTAMLTERKLSNLFNTPLKLVEANGYRQVVPGMIESTDR